MYSRTIIRGIAIKENWEITENEKMVTSLN